jgi:hypothetical protein
METHKAPAVICLVFERHHQRLLKYSEIPSLSPQDFFNLLHEVHPVPSGVHNTNLLDPHDILAVDPAKEQFKDLLEVIFFRSSKAYLDAKTNSLH